MDDYLNRYCKYVKEIKTVISIKDTVNFIENDLFDITEIIFHYKNIFNIDKICSLLHNEEFLINYNYNKKVDVFLEFFSNLHNYAKNLIKDFDIYSSKTVEPSNVVMKDNIMLFPHYKRYMSKFLGYDYDPVKGEWRIRNKLSREGLYNFAALCLLTATGYTRITEINDEILSTGEDSEESTSEELKNPKVIPIDSWICEKCTFQNKSQDYNCSSCFNNKGKMPDSGNGEKVNNETINIVDNRKRYNDENVEIEDFENEEDQNDKIEKSHLGKNEVGNSANERQLKEINNTIKNKNNMIKNENVDNKARKGSRLNKNEWECEKCTFVNDSMNICCTACYEKRTIPPMRDTKWVGDVSRIQNKWKCTQCTLFNNNTNSKCEACMKERYKNQNNEHNRRCEDCNCVDVMRRGCCCQCHGKKLNENINPTLSRPGQKSLPAINKNIIPQRTQEQRSLPQPETQDLLDQSERKFHKTNSQITNPKENRRKQKSSKILIPEDTKKGKQRVKKGSFFKYLFCVGAQKD